MSLEVVDKLHEDVFVDFDNALRAGMEGFAQTTQATQVTQTSGVGASDECESLADNSSEDSVCSPKEMELVPPSSRAGNSPHRDREGSSLTKPDGGRGMPNHSRSSPHHHSRVRRQRQPKYWHETRTCYLCHQYVAFFSQSQCCNVPAHASCVSALNKCYVCNRVTPQESAPSPLQEEDPPSTCSCCVQ